MYLFEIKVPRTFHPSVLTRIPVTKKATAVSVIPIVKVTEAIKIGREAIHSSKRFS
jgi:hypothetical protein